MAQTENLLTAKKIEAALKNGTPIKLNDGGGLFLSITGKNEATWFMRGRLNGVQKRRTLGNEKMTLAQARTKRNEEREALKEGRDTIREKKETLENLVVHARTFHEVADEWMTHWQLKKTPRP